MALRNKDKGFVDRPHPLMIEIWRTAQRVMEHAIRAKQELGISYAASARLLLAKADFLLAMEPCVLSQVIGSTIAPIAPLLVLPPRDRDGDGDNYLMGLLSAQGRVGMAGTTTNPNPNPAHNIKSTATLSRSQMTGIQVQAAV